MDVVRQYLLSITATAVICSLIMSFVGKKNAHASMIRILCGLFMTVTMITPLLKIRVSDYTAYYANILTDADSAVAEGDLMAEEAMAAIIKDKTEAYILDKALSMGLSVEVEVTLSNSETMRPHKVLLTGDASPYAKMKLTEVIMNDLGIPKENQAWT